MVKAQSKTKTSSQRAQPSAKQTPAKAHKKVGEKKAKTPTAPKKAEAAKPAPTKDKKKSAAKKAEAAKPAPTKGKKKSAPKKAEAAKPAPTKGKKKSAAKKSKGTQRRAKGCDDDEDDEDEKDKDDEDEEDDEVADPPGLKGPAAVDAYFKTKKSQSKPPSEEVLNQFEFDARAAQLMFHENTGFALDDASVLLENARSPDAVVRKKAIDELATTILNIGPDLSQKNEIRDLFYSQGGDHSQQLQCCACCGRKEFQQSLHAKHYRLDDAWCDQSAILHLSAAEKVRYIGSRVEGYLNLTVLKYVALKNKQSLSWAYNELYGRGKTDVAFHKAATEAEVDAAAAAAATAAVAAAASVGGVPAQSGDGALVSAVLHAAAAGADDDDDDDDDEEDEEGSPKKRTKRVPSAAAAAAAAAIAPSGGVVVVVGDGNGKDEAPQVLSRPHLQVIFLVPMLIKFSENVYDPSAVPVNYGTMTICLQCRDQMGKKTRPSFSMGGSFKCDFGYPEFLDGLNGQTPTPAELLCLSKARPYVQIVKARQDHSPGDPNRGMTGHIITFLHENLSSRKKGADSYPRKDLPSHLSIVLLGSDDGSVASRERIKKGLLAKGPIALRPPPRQCSGSRPPPAQCPLRRRRHSRSDRQ